MEVRMRLPEHLEIVSDEYGCLMFGRGPFTMFIRNKNTKEITRIVIPMPSPTQENLCEFFRHHFKRAIKEHMNEDVQYR